MRSPRGVIHLWRRPQLRLPRRAGRGQGHVRLAHCQEAGHPRHFHGRHHPRRDQGGQRAGRAARRRDQRGRPRARRRRHGHGAQAAGRGRRAGGLHPCAWRRNAGRGARGGAERAAAAAAHSPPSPLRCVLPPLLVLPRRTATRAPCSRQKTSKGFACVRARARAAAAAASTPATPPRARALYARCHSSLLLLWLHPRAVRLSRR